MPSEKKISEILFEIEGSMRAAKDALSAAAAQLSRQERAARTEQKAEAIRRFRIFVLGVASETANLYWHLRADTANAVRLEGEEILQAQEIADQICEERTAKLNALAVESLIHGKPAAIERERMRAEAERGFQKEILTTGTPDLGGLR